MAGATGRKHEMSKPFLGKYNFPITDAEIAYIAGKADWFFMSRPTGIRKLNPLAWWQYYKIRKEVVAFWSLFGK